MSWIVYWPLMEMVFVILISSLFIWSLWRAWKKRGKQWRPAPRSFGGRLWAAGLYVLRLAGLALGSLAALLLFIMIERSIFSVITETAPTPSQVSIPADLGFEVEEAAFESEDGLKIAGWYTPSQNGVVIILLHGYGSNRTQMTWHAQQLTAAGYGVLMYDERASGESQGDHRSYGWEDPRDVGGALAYLASREDSSDDAVGIAGCSIGGQIALQGAAYYPEIGAVWADGPGVVRAQDIPPSRNPMIMLIKAGTYVLDMAYQVRLGTQAPPPLIDIIGAIEPRPAMIVMGGTEVQGLGSEADRDRYLLDFAGEHTDMWVIPEATHCDGPQQRPEEYSQRMIVFFDQAFDIERR